ncbi:hypothetical protein SESBI_10211 [Sesbania bispinosa]|nr:hypothetical protein SESBI_10211 [Sesbania bispinosa]
MNRCVQESTKGKAGQWKYLEEQPRALCGEEGGVRRASNKIDVDGVKCLQIEQVGKSVGSINVQRRVSRHSGECGRANNMNGAGWESLVEENYTFREKT